MKKQTVSVIHIGDLAIVCHQGHLKLSEWQIATSLQKPLRHPRFLPSGNWKMFELPARNWLSHSTITLQEGEFVLLPRSVTLSDFLS